MLGRNANTKFAHDGEQCHNGLIGLHLNTPPVKHKAEFHPTSKISYIDDVRWKWCDL
jgi:hypothetical protein